jgi:hypothetical protein
MLMIIRILQMTGTYFTDLDEQAADEIARLWAQMRAQAGRPPGEGYLARVARLNALRKQAEEVVLAERILLATRTRPHAEPGCPGAWEPAAGGR